MSEVVQDKVFKSLFILAFGAWAAVVWDVGKNISQEIALVREALSATKSDVAVLSVRLETLSDRLREFERKLELFGHRLHKKFGVEPPNFDLNGVWGEVPHSNARWVGGRYLDSTEVGECADCSNS